MADAQQMVGGDVIQLLGDLLECLSVITAFPVDARRKQIVLFNLLFQQLRGEERGEGGREVEEGKGGEENRKGRGGLSKSFATLSCCPL